MSDSSIAPPGSRQRKPTRRPSCSTASSSARASSFSSVVRGGARSWWRSRPANWSKTKNETRPVRRTPAASSTHGCLRCALQALDAFAVIAAALLDPLHAAIGIGGLVGIVLIDAGVHARLAFRLLGIFLIDGRRVHRRPSRRSSGCRLLLRFLLRFLLGFLGRSRRGRSCRRGRGGRGVGTALGLAEVV